MSVRSFELALLSPSFILSLRALPWLTNACPLSSRFPTAGARVALCELSCCRRHDLRTARKLCQRGNDRRAPPLLWRAVIKNWILKIVDARAFFAAVLQGLSSPPPSLPLPPFPLPFLPALWIILEHECRSGHKASGEADKENLVSRLNFLADQGAKSQRNSYVQHAIS